MQVTESAMAYLPTIGDRPSPQAQSRFPLRIWQARSRAFRRQTRRRSDR
ncbi:hypothetical protein [Nostoc sp.]